MYSVVVVVRLVISMSIDFIFGLFRVQCIVPLLVVRLETNAFGSPCNGAPLFDEAETALFVRLQCVPALSLKTL